MASDPSGAAASQLRRAALALAISLVAAIAFTVWLETRSPPSVVTTGEAQINPSFRLRAPEERVVTDSDFRGRVMVVYFGWRLDPDVTPAALQVLAAALERLGPKSNDYAPIFISLDPERDRASDLRDYLGKLGLKAVGLVGTPAETAQLATAYKLYFKRIADVSLPGGYSIDHASLYYVMGKDGTFRGIIPHTNDVQALADELRQMAN